ncbi:MAG: 50S ribosomal protein L22 [Acidobacteria bacterium]|nr:50S ribosomal protein L22 [Acidobacteriota bacterium]
MIARARMRYLRSSAQKTRLVIDQIRGLGVNRAVALLRESPKAVSRDVVKVLRSAVANAEKGDQRVDADTLYVSRAVVDGGPSFKRIRPATFGRAFRVLRRTCHITLELDAREEARPRESRARRRAESAKAAGDRSAKAAGDKVAKGSGEKAQGGAKAEAGARTGSAKPATAKPGTTKSESTKTTKVKK